MATLEELMPVFVRDLQGVGVPFVTGSPLPVSIRRYPQMVPVVLDWIANYRDRIEPGGWYPFGMVCQAIARGWKSPHPELAAAFIQEYRRIVALDFQKIVPDLTWREGNSKKISLTSVFSYALADVAGPENHEDIKDLILDPSTQPYSTVLIDPYLAKSKAKDVPEIIGEALASSDLNIYRYAALVAGRRKYTQFRDQVQSITDECLAEPEIDFYWRDRLVTASYALNRKAYAEAHKGADVRDLIEALGDEGSAAFAAYVLGVRKESAAAQALRPLVTSKITRLRQEVKAALKKIDNAPNPH